MHVDKEKKLLFIHIKVKSETVSHSVMSDSYDPIDCYLPDSSVHEILQARIWSD